MTKLQSGAKQAIDNCLSVGSKDRVLIVTDKDTLEIGQALFKASRNKSQDTKLLTIEDYTDRPAKELPEKMRQVIIDFAPTVAIYAASGQMGELPVFRRPLTELFFKTLRCRYAHMIGITKALMEEGMNQDYQAVYKLTRKICSIAQTATQMHISDPHGTDITFELDPKNLKWLPSDGKITADKWQNLPSGETYTCPVTGNGKFVSWVLGDYLSPKYGALQNPLTVTIVDGFITEIHNSDPIIQEDFKSYVDKYENGRRVGELAIGTLVGLKQFVGNLLQDEKFPSVHLAFGYPYPDETGATWTCQSHIDIIAKDTTVKFLINDEWKMIMRDGVFEAEL